MMRRPDPQGEVLARIGFGLILLALVFMAAALGWGFVKQVRAQEGPAQPPQCGRFAEIERLLLEQYGELPVGSGMSGRVAGGNKIWLFVNSRAGGWTVLSVREDGAACMTGAGTGWRFGDPGMERKL